MLDSENTCTCIKCGKEMQNLMDEQLQPVEGCAFRTYGHYGTAVFDPMDGSFLEIAVCDTCLSAAIEKSVAIELKAA